tara:strand:- start:678 stop:5105 length:4428 start_codon:yes stop_codon:yes gene_type:complete
MAQNYFKRNYKDALDNIIPSVYVSTPVETSGMAVSQIDEIINSHINFCVNQPALLNISAVTTGTFSGIDTVSGLSRWFLPENINKNKLTPLEFEIQILHKLGLCTGQEFGEPCTYFNCSSTDCQSDLSGIPYAKMLSFFKTKVLPKIVLNSNSLAETTTSAFSTTASGTHEYLINSLGWPYFLNTTGPVESPSGYVASALTDMYMSGTNFLLNDGIKGAAFYIWKNWTSLSSIDSSLLPLKYYTGTGEYTSGTQGLDRLNTLIDVIYSDQIATREDDYISVAFEDYIDNGFLLDNRERTGPLSKFIEGVAYSLFDINNEAAKIQSLYDLDKCPDNLLKYVAELIGWDLKGSNPRGWRRQLRYAVSLYKQKGTKEGLYNAMTTVLPGTALEMSSISEFYESYIPLLMYYLIKTDSSLFDSFTSWNQSKAALYTSGEYSFADMDLNIRLVLDHMMLKAVTKFNDLFYVRNFEFNPGDPNFVFNYRDRSFPIPPWEEIKFYRSCDITPELLRFFKEELICLGVSPIQATNFYNYVSQNTIYNTYEPTYGNSFLFFTSSLNTAPNETTILDNMEISKYNYLSMWNSKSSTFNVSVSSGTFDTEFFNSSIYTKNDFFQSLSIVDDFSPAKAIARTHVDLIHTDYMRQTVYTCPSIRFPMQDITVSGFQGGSNASGVFILGIPGASGGSYPTPANSSRARNTHTDLPVFKRSFVDEPTDFVQMEGSALTAPPTSSNVFRTNKRKRNFSNNLLKGGWYTRTGYSMPSYYNLSSGSDKEIEFYVQGFVNSQYRYNPVINFKNLTEVSGSWPWDSSLWSQCYNTDSTLSYEGIPVSSTFNVRGSNALSADTCDEYVMRDRPPEFVYFLHKLLDKKYTKEAERIYEVNNFLIDTSAFLNPINCIKNRLWDSTTEDLSVFYDLILGKRIFSRGSIDGMHKMYKDYISYFTGTGIGNGLLDTYDDGGANILSHIYGPLFLNGRFTTDGSAIVVSSNLINADIYNETVFTVSSLGSLGNITASTIDSMYVEKIEYRNPYVLSGVELVDSTSGLSEYSIFRLGSDSQSVNRDNYNIHNTLCVTDPKGGFPRIRFNLKDYGELTNLIIPERNYDLTLNALIGRKSSDMLGGGSYGVWIHTDVETDYDNKKVFWNFMPNGQWQQMDASILQNTGAINYVKQYLAHALDYSDLYPIDLDDCFAQETDKEVIGSLQEDDFLSRSVNFDTNNNDIKLSLSYYKQFEQVHRPDQNYIVEVFLYNNSDPTLFSVIDYLSVVDSKQHSRAFVKHPITYHSYDKYKDLIIDDVNFYDSSGGLVGSGVSLSADSNGNITTSSGDSITTHIAHALGPVPSWGNLYSQSLITKNERWVKDANTNVSYFTSSVYDGIFTLNSSGISSPSSITIVGKTKGSSISIHETLYVPLDPEDVLIMLREFKRLQAGMGARDKSISASEFGPEGGSRLNYRFAPMWGQTGLYATFEDNTRSYTRVNVEN